MNAMLIAILLFQLIFLAILVVMVLKIRRIYLDLMEFITSPDKDTPSPLARVVNKYLETVQAGIKGIIMGIISGETRGTQAALTEIAEEGIGQQMPLAGGLLGMLSKRSKNKLLSNPLLLTGLQTMFSRMGNNPGNGSQPAKQNNEPVKYNYD